MKRVLAIIICASLLVQGGALAHEGEMHEAHKDDPYMQKLHDMMPKYAIASTKLETALEKKDVAAVEAEAGKMLATVSQLKKSKPHKNLSQLKTYRSIAASFERDLKETVELAKKGDFAKSYTTFKNVEAKCAECHAKFRD